jgi:ribose transport system ATP-binding protein
MRDGQYIDTKELGETSRKDLINMMVGRELNEAFPAREVTPGEIVMETKNLCGNGVFDINLNLHKGEILGLAGLIGAGRTELAKLLFGDVTTDSGEIIINNEKVKFRKTQDAIMKGIGLIPEDRKREGAFLEFPIDWNISIMNLKRLSKWTLINNKMLDEVGNHYQEVLRIKTPSMSQLVKNLSGGNQQKVVVAKVLATQASILIFDEPTRGIDVGAKQEIYKLMNDLIKQGMSIIMISSEMEELIGMCDRIIVLHEGRQTGELKKEEFNQQKILELASGI